MTLKFIKNFPATDITRYSFEECQKLRKKAQFEIIHTSRGTCGINGAVLLDNLTGEYYKITSRNSVLYYFV